MRWDQRPIELANLINPAFCSILLRDTIDQFALEIDSGLDFSLSFLVLPLVLHKPTRTLLPSQMRSSLPEWIENHRKNLVLFPNHVTQLIPYTQESIIFGLQHGLIQVGSKESFLGKLMTTSVILNDSNEWSRDSEPVDCRNKARLIGRWFAQIDNTSTTYRLLGVRP